MTTEPTFVSTAGAGPDADVDAMLDVLGSNHRRRVLSALADQPGPVALDDLASAVATRTRTDDLRTVLHHVHLPKLDDVGLVAYDADARVAAGTARLQAVADHLAADGE